MDLDQLNEELLDENKFVATVAMLLSMGMGSMAISRMLNTSQDRVQKAIQQAEANPRGASGSQQKEPQRSQGHRARLAPLKPKESQRKAYRDTPGSPSISQLMEFIEQWEGRRSMVYLDTVGKSTVGVGFNLNRDGAANDLQRVGANYWNVINGNSGLTREQIDELFENDVKDSLNYASSLIPNFHWMPIEAQMIYVDMMFNLGYSKLAGFERMLAALKNLDFKTAADEMQDSTWYGQTGRRARNHVKTIRSLGN